MSLLEGFSDYVMDEVGRDLVPDVERISARFHERRTRRTPFERAMLRLTGMDLKMEQYKKGERSCGPSPTRAARRRCAACGTAPRRCRATARSRIPSAGSRASWTASRGMSGRGRTGEPTACGARRPGQRAGRRAGGDRPQPDPVGPLSVARPGADPRRGAGRAARDRLGRGPGGRAARRRRGDAPRLAARRTPSTACSSRAPRLSWVHSATVGRGAGPDAGGARARAGRHQRPRRVQPADRRVRADDDPRGQPAAAAAARAPARADLAAARGRRAARRDRRHRRPRLDRAGGRRAGDGVRLPGRRGPPPRRGGHELRDRRGRGRRARVRRADARPGRRTRDAARAAGRVRLHRARRAADARDRGDDQRPDAGAWSSPAPG